jgi:ETC complex I subunit-like protein
MLQTMKSAQERWAERVSPTSVPITTSVFPDDAVAIIYKPARSAMTSGRARSKQWKLRFEPRSPRVIEPLMGWTASGDTLAQVELTFPSAQAAVSYARRQGLSHVVQRDDSDGRIHRLTGVSPVNTPKRHAVVGSSCRLDTENTTAAA